MLKNSGGASRARCSRKKHIKRGLAEIYNYVKAEGGVIFEPSLTCAKSIAEFFNTIGRNADPGYLALIVHLQFQCSPRCKFVGLRVVESRQMEAVEPAGGRHRIFCQIVAQARAGYRRVKPR